MTLLSCPDCGKGVSSTGENCLNCGFDMKRHPEVIAESQKLGEKLDERQKKADKQRVIGWVLAVALAILILITMVLDFQLKEWSLYEPIRWVTRILFVALVILTLYRFGMAWSIEEEGIIDEEEKD